MTNAARLFDLSDALSIITGRNVSKGGFAATRELVEFLTGQAMTDLGMVMTRERCRKSIQAQNPGLDTPEAAYRIALLDAVLETETGRAEPDKVIAGWVEEMRKIVPFVILRPM